MKVAIIGGAPRTRDNAPFDDEDWEIWVLANLSHQHTKRITRMFQIHDELSDDHLKELEEQVMGYIPMTVGKDFPFKADHIDIFPFDEANSLMEEGHLTSSISYMMVYAILKGATHISIYGVDMDVDDTEYFKQRPGLYAWVGYARGKGIIVDAPGSSLLQESQYPISINISPPFTKLEFEKMRDLHDQKMKEAQAKIEQLNDLHATHYGCKQVYERLAKIARATESGIKVNSITDSTMIRR